MRNFKFRYRSNNRTEKTLKSTYNKDSSTTVVLFGERSTILKLTSIHCDFIIGTVWIRFYSGIFYLEPDVTGIGRIVN